jgi:hypothetical protein
MSVDRRIYIMSTLGEVEMLAGKPCKLSCCTENKISSPIRGVRGVSHIYLNRSGIFRIAVPLQKY